MLDAPVRRALQAKMQMAQLVFVALLSSLMIYLVIGYVLSTQREPPGNDALIELLVPVLGVAALVSLIASFTLRARLLRKAIAELPAQIEESNAEGVVRAVLTPWILGWALCESVAICGLILFVLTFRWDLFLPFWGIGVAAMLAQAPSQRTLKRALRSR